MTVGSTGVDLSVQYAKTGTSENGKDNDESSSIHRLQISREEFDALDYFE